MKKQDPIKLPEYIWVKCKNNGKLRYVTRHTNSQCFEDDGKMSGKQPSIFCHFENYEKF